MLPSGIFCGGVNRKKYNAEDPALFGNALILVTAKVKGVKEVDPMTITIDPFSTT